MKLNKIEWNETHFHALTIVVHVKSNICLYIGMQNHTDHRIENGNITATICKFTQFIHTGRHFQRCIQIVFQSIMQVIVTV